MVVYSGHLPKEPGTKKTLPPFLVAIQALGYLWGRSSALEWDKDGHSQTPTHSRRPGHSSLGSVRDVLISRFALRPTSRKTPALEKPHSWEHSFYLGVLTMSHGTNLARRLSLSTVQNFFLSLLVYHSGNSHGSPQQTLTEHLLGSRQRHRKI